MNATRPSTGKKSTIATGLEEGNSLLKKLNDLVQNVASLKIPASVILTPAGSALITRKIDALTALAAACPVTKAKLSDVTRRLRVWNNQMRQRDMQPNSARNILLNCARDPFFSWEEARDNLAEAAVNSDEPLRPLTHKQLETCMELLQSSNATPVSTIMAMIGADGEKSGSFYLSVLQQLLSLFPVMRVSRVTDQRCVLSNMNDFSLLARGDTFADIFCLCEDVAVQEPVRQGEPQTMSSSAPQASDANIPMVHHRPQLKPGRRPYYMEFPELVTTVSDFVKLHGYAAEARRRTTVGNAMGVSLADIVQHVKEQITELKEKGISRGTIHSLLVAP